MSQEFQEAQKALYAKQCEECDVIITTALVPGKPAPKLVSKVRTLSHLQLFVFWRVPCIKIFHIMIIFKA